ncbi:MAG: DNA replication/repair protein RecF [Nannocystaceae bacterium]
MLLRGLELRDYRNLAEARLRLEPGFTVLWGHNGAGKTNVLEALYLVSTLRSFRTSDQGVLVRHDAPGAWVGVQAFDEALGVGTSLEVRLERRGKSTRRTATADGKVVRSGAQFYGRVRAVLFTPEDLGVLRGSPTGRRQFMDRVIFARDRAHITDVQAYDKLLRSRNRVLKNDGGPGPAQRENLLSTYEAGLADTGARMWTRRVQLLHDLQQRFGDAFGAIHGELGASPHGGGEAAQAALSYACKLGDIEPEQRVQALREGLLDRRELDLRRGTTSVGPHRDDLLVELDGQPAGDFASQGQSRALVLAFKLAEVQAARDLHRSPPLLLLDDVSSELDPRRTALLFRTLGEHAGQCILTTTSPRYIELPPAVQSRRYRVDRGTVAADDGDGE